MQPRIGVGIFVGGLVAIAAAHSAYVFFLYRARVITHSCIASSDFVLFALPALLAFAGYYALLAVRRPTWIPHWVGAFLLTLLSLWLSMLLPFNTHGT
jgi:hypothetical protein